MRQTSWLSRAATRGTLLDDRWLYPFTARLDHRNLFSDLFNDHVQVCETFEISVSELTSNVELDADARPKPCIRTDSQEGIWVRERQGDWQRLGYQRDRSIWGEPFRPYNRRDDRPFMLLPSDISASTGTLQVEAHLLFCLCHPRSMPYQTFLTSCPT
jgi:hypothetical protein